MLVKSTLFLFGLVSTTSIAMAKQFTPVDLIQLARPGVPVISPNGTFAVYSQSAYNIEEAKVSIKNNVAIVIHTRTDTWYDSH